MKIRSKEEILGIVRQLAKSKSKNYLTQKEFYAETRISVKQLIKHGWLKYNDMIQEAGLIPLSYRGKPDREPKFSKNYLVEAARNLASKLQKHYLSQSEFPNHLGISYRPINTAFPENGWRGLLKEAGLQQHPAHKSRLNDDELYAEFCSIVRDIGEIPSYPLFIQKAKRSMGTYESRGGNFTEFKKRALNYGIQKNLLPSEFLKSPNDILSREPLDKNLPTYEKFSDRPTLGERIDFGPLTREPLHEPEVIFLFGILAEKMGFRIESIIGTAYPDCQAERRTKQDWQKVKIEFEVNSSNFLAHGHDISGSDIIVCWDNDWPWEKCPLEIIELKSWVNKIKKR